MLPCNWWKCLKDYRFSKSQEWNLGYILEVLLAGALSGCKTLREVETLSEIYAERVPDTTLHDIMVRLNPEGLKEELAKGVKQALRAHELDSEFPVRITAIDGKALYNTRRAVNDCSEHIGGGGEGQYRHMTLRAMHVSSDTKLCLGQREIPCKGAETTELLPFVDELTALYGRTDLLEVISVDAGMVSRKNATELCGRGLDYIMALKGGQGTLYHHARGAFTQHSKPDAVEEEIVNGKQITRSAFHISAPDNFVEWEHLREFWKVHKISIHPNGEVEEETRYFMTSLSPEVLSSQQILEAVRMHWGIENNANWTLDALWKEDSAPWTSKAMSLVAHLRMMAFNIIARLRMRRLKAKEHRTLAWKDFFRFFEHALCRIRACLESQGKETPAFL